MGGRSVGHGPMGMRRLERITLDTSTKKRGDSGSGSSKSYVPAHRRFPSGRDIMNRAAAYTREHCGDRMIFVPYIDEAGERVVWVNSAADEDRPVAWEQDMGETTGSSSGLFRCGGRSSRSSNPASSTHESPRLPPVSTSGRVPLLAGRSVLTASLERAPPDGGYSLSGGGEFSEQVWGVSTSVVNTVYLDTTDQDLFRSQIAEALARMPLAGPVEIRDLAGPSYINSILTDSRIAGR